MDEVFNQYTNALIDKHGAQLISDFQELNDKHDELDFDDYKKELNKLSEKYELSDFQTIAVMRDITK